MRFSDLISNVVIQMSNEEHELFKRITKPCYFDSLSEREQVVAINLIRKSLISKVNYKGSVVVIQNENS